MKVMPKTDTEQLAQAAPAGLARTLSPQTYMALKAGLAGGAGCSGCC